MFVGYNESSDPIRVKFSLLRLTRRLDGIFWPTTLDIIGIASASAAYKVPASY